MEIGNLVRDEFEFKCWNIYDGEDIWKWEDVLKRIFEGKVDKIIPEKHYILLPQTICHDCPHDVVKKMDNLKFPPCYTDLYINKQYEVKPKAVFLIDSFVLSPENNLHFILADVLTGEPLKANGFKSVNLVIEPQDIGASIRYCVNRYRPKEDAEYQTWLEEI